MPKWRVAVSILNKYYYYFKSITDQELTQKPFTTSSRQKSRSAAKAATSCQKSRQQETSKPESDRSRFMRSRRRRRGLPTGRRTSVDAPRLLNNQSSFLISAGEGEVVSRTYNNLGATAVRKISPLIFSDMSRRLIIFDSPESEAAVRPIR
jgi:hypothetical protein